MSINTELLAQVCEGFFYIVLAVLVALAFGYALHDWIGRDKDEQ